MIFGGERLDLLDISAGGLACVCGSVRAGETRQISFVLPGEASLVTAKVQILAVTDDHICHARFMDLTPETADAIHQYALTVQKLVLQKQRQRQDSPGLS